MTVASTNVATIKYADGAFLALVDRATKGAASDFIEVCRPTLEMIRGDAAGRWPVKTGASRDRLALQSSVTATEVRAMIVNTSPYTYYIRFSRWTKADMIVRATELSAKGTAPDRLRSHILAKLYKVHGKGAPADMAGKPAWTQLVATPAKAALTELLPRLRASMGRLAGAS